MRINLQYKITLIFALIFAFVSLGIYSHLNKNLRERTYRRISSEIKRQVSLLVSYMENSPLKSDENWDDRADHLAQKLNLRVTIISLKGVVLGDSELDGDSLRRVENHLYRPEVQEALISGVGQSRRFSTTIRKDMLYVASVYGKSSLEGTVRLAVPLSEVELISEQLRKTVGASLSIGLILAIIISFLASIFISKPLREISNVTQDMGRGVFNRKLLVSSNDEIGDLAIAFNYMSDQVSLRMEEINLSRSRLEAVFLNMIEGVMVLDSEGKIILMNRTLKDFLSISNNPVGKKPIEVIRNIEVQEAIEHALEDSFHLKTFEVTLLAPREKVISVNAAPVIRSGKAEGAVLVFHDITNFRRLETVRKDFVANVSHELRTPISTIKGYAETLLEGALDDKANAKDFAQIILSDSNRLAALIDDLLDLSKIESDNFDIELKPIKLRPVAERVVQGLNKNAEEKGISIKIDMDNDMPMVLGDEGRISQVLLNLIDNALKYNRPGGSVTIKSGEKGGIIQVDVSDDGIGIPESDIPRLFERFYRVDKARSRELGGTGLGLSIVKHIVSAHKGDVWVKSRQGKGSTFSFTLQKA